MTQVAAVVIASYGVRSREHRQALDAAAKCHLDQSAEKFNPNSEWMFLAKRLFHRYSYLFCVELWAYDPLNTHL